MRREEMSDDDQVVGWIRILRGRRPVYDSMVKSALLCSLEEIQRLRREVEELKKPTEQEVAER